MNITFGKTQGYASKLDLQDTSWQYLYSTLKSEQDLFLENAEKFRGSDYKWPLDALHNWSRIWEYPYIYSKFINYEKNLKVMDFGSGVTFFPHSLSKLGHNITCIDNDPICVRDNIRASNFYSETQNYGGKINAFNINDLSAEEGQYDVIYSISVLEHIPNPSEYIEFFYKNLKPKGRLLLTMDIDLRGNEDLSPEKLELIKKSIEGKFSLASEISFTHPNNYLSTINSIYPYEKEKSKELKRLFKRILSGKKLGPYPMTSSYLCILALDLIKN